MLMDLPVPLELALLALVGLVGGVVESTAGGSGLITLPTLMMLGVPPLAALSTSKFQYAFGATVSVVRFWRAGLIDGRSLVAPFTASFLSGAAGAMVLSVMSAELVGALVPLFLIIAAAFFARSPSFGDNPGAARIGPATMALLVVPFIGFYDGFFGVGSASLFVMAFVALRGMDVRRATAATKLIDFASGGAALLVLASGGHVLWGPGLALAAGQSAGAFIGAGLVMRHGVRWVRPVIVIVTTGLCVQLLRQHGDVLFDLVARIVPGL